MDTEQIICEIQKMKERTKLSNIKVNKFELTDRIILRLASFPNCSECKILIDKFVSIVQELNNDSIENLNKKYSEFEKNALLHLQKEHKLVTQGYYMNMFLACGVAIGISFGVPISQFLGQPAYIGLGLPLGMALGVAIGSSYDAKAKKDGLVI